jgi:hypothetical protein
MVATSDMLAIEYGVRYRPVGLPRQRTAVGNDFLIGTERTLFGKILHAQMQRVSVFIPEAQGFTLGIETISASKFQGPPGRRKRLVEGHGFPPCAAHACLQGLQSHKKKPNHHPSTASLETAFGSGEP